MKILTIAVMIAVAASAADRKNVLVYKEPGRFGGWPANHGIWSWGNEIVVGFSAAYFKHMPLDRHQYDDTKPEEPRLVRSLDGGNTWTIEAPKSLLPPEQGGAAALLAHRVDGILLSCADSFTRWERLERRQVPFVFFDRLPVGFHGAAVALDNRTAAAEATRFLIGLGHRRIAIIAGSQKVSPGIARLEGFREATEAAHVSVPNQYVRYGEFSIDGGYQSALELIALPSPPTAILSCNNKMTLGLMRAMAEQKVSCPDAVSVIGFDDFEWSANFSPRLTSVAQPTRAMGRKAMEMLLDQINSTGQYVSPGTVMFQSELIVRDSTAPPR
jgi:LacI family transcriptional regulator